MPRRKDPGDLEWDLDDRDQALESGELTGPTDLTIEIIVGPEE